MGILISLAGAAQPSVKLYGYSQVSTPGMVPQRDIPNENGGTVKTRIYDSIISFFIYTRASVAIRPSQVYLNGKWQSATSLAISSTPVKSEQPVKKTLVPSTKLKVLQLLPGDLVSNMTISSSLKKMMAVNELIVAYTWKGKKYYVPLKKITVLQPIHAY